MNKKNNFLFFLFTIILLASCSKENVYVYEVNDISLKQQGTNKPNVKTTVEFISIAYSDIFGKTISQTDLTILSQAYISFGDTKVIEDLIIRNFLNRPNTLPSKTDMTNDVAKFVRDTYKKLLNREPDEFESWFMIKLIQSDNTLTPELFYYAILTSNEYRYY